MVKDDRYRRPPGEVLVGSWTYIESLSLLETSDLSEAASSVLTEVAIASLSDLDREVFYLRYGEGKSLREIGLHFGRSKGWAQHRVKKLHERVRQELERRSQTST